MQVLAFQERVRKLEQEKEHWMLESQLVQVKMEKEKKVLFRYTLECEYLCNI